MNKLEKIFVVFKTHFDFGFTALPGEVLAEYKNYHLPKAVKTCKESMKYGENHKYVWTLPAWLLLKCLDDLKGTVLYKDIDSLIKSRMITWHYMPMTTHTEAMGLEDFIRGFLPAEELSKRYGYNVRTAKMTDVPGHTWILPSLLYKAGIKFFHIGCNECATPPDVPDLFFWEGPDGNRVLTMYSKSNYGTGITPPEGWKYPVWLDIEHTEDNIGTHNAGFIGKLLEKGAEYFPGVEIQTGSLDDFADAILSENLDLPVIRGDLADSWIHGVGTYPEEVSMVRTGRNKITSLESIISMKNIFDPEDGCRETEKYKSLIDDAYDLLLMFGEHTWGIDTKIAMDRKVYGKRCYTRKDFLEKYSNGEYERAIISWKEKSGYARKASQIIGKCENEIAISEETGQFTFFNSGMNKFNGMVPVKKSPKSCVIDMKTGEKVKKGSFKGDEFLVLKDVPPMGYRQYKTSDESEESGNCRLLVETGDSIILENRKICLEITKTDGRIVSFYDRENEIEYIDNSNPAGFGEYVYDIYSRDEINRYLKLFAYNLTDWFINDNGKPDYPDIKHKTWNPVCSEVKAENGSGCSVLKTTFTVKDESFSVYGNAGEIIREIFIYEDEKYIDINFRIKDKQKTPFLEAGHIIFPLQLDGFSVAINKTGVVVDPGKDIVKGANHHLFCCDKWVDLSNGKAGMLFIPRDTPLFSVSGKGIEKFYREFQPEKPDIYFNLFNNQWGTNFPQWIEGDFNYKFRLLPHSGNWREARAWEQALSVFNPPVMTDLNYDDSEASLFRDETGTLETVVFKKGENKEDFVLRLREAAGSKKSFKRIILNKKIKEVMLSSLSEKNDKVIPVKDIGDYKIAEIEFNSYEVITLKISFKCEDCNEKKSKQY